MPEKTGSFCGARPDGNGARTDAMEAWNGKIIDAIVEREKEVCPGALALIGVYGSFLTGDVHPLSDLDLLILINDERGRALAESFVAGDPPVGYDLYCTTWEDLRRDARCEHPNLSKLMDSRIVYCADERYGTELEALRDEARRLLSAPFDREDLDRAAAEFGRAGQCFADALLGEDLGMVRRHAGGALYYAENAVALLNKAYFRLGVRRRYEELGAMERRPEDLCALIEGVVSAGTAEGVKDRLTALMKALADCFRAAERSLRQEKGPVRAEELSGTWEEMYSNWHGKMALAAETGDRHLAFMSLSSLNEMLADLSDEAGIAPRCALSAYDPEDLQKSAEGFDAVLDDVLREYGSYGVQVKRRAPELP